MHSFTPGQRWISDTESELGLGTILSLEGRQLTILFPATGDTRQYAANNAPLTRVEFAPGDSVKSDEDWSLTVERVEQVSGLLIYQGIRDDNGDTAELPETQLSNYLQFNRAQDRLLAGQIDRNDWFNLRYETLRHYNRVEQSPLLGLHGPRIDLIPHQLYIAQEVGRRSAPRVLLADEVGLGKTIEAGLILHQQLLSGRANRALIIVPEPLLHQWLVELLRRFNLHFSLFDEERAAHADADNPFDSEQLVLCSLELFSRAPHLHEQAQASQWDLLIVDEAHHLQWDESEASPEYQQVEQLAQQSRGLLLLTGTPEQLGLAGHFARLRLLDPDRFYSYDQFRREAQQYAAIATAVNRLLDEATLNDAECAELAPHLPEADSQALLALLANPEADTQQRAEAREQLVQQLLDRHGTGRVLFRNTRHSVAGFPERQLHSYPLQLPADYESLYERLQSDAVFQEDFEQVSPEPYPQALLFPEQAYQCAPVDIGTVQEHWWQIDTRVSWLQEKLVDLAPEKVLVICAHTDTARELAEALRLQAGISAAAFHEGLTIVERDRAGAWFADQEDGAQVLVCSEIGSEGRNFQFAHHLVLFDLPLNPDLLEQRIGRLDRIGQSQRVEIHVPYYADTAQAVLFHWYQQGLNAFEHTCPAGQTLYQQLAPALLTQLEQGAPEDHDCRQLIERTSELLAETSAQLEQGRNRLLELNACRPGVATKVVEEIAAQDQRVELPIYMEAVFDIFGVNNEDHSDYSQILKPGSQMLGSFPGLSREDSGMTVTYDRETALAREDMQFLSWEHPMVQGAMDQILSSEMGNTAVALLKNPAIPAGTLLLETIFTVSCIAPRALQAGRFLPPTTIRTLIDPLGNNLGPKVAFDKLTPQLQKLKKAPARDVVRTQQTLIRQLLQHAQTHAEAELPTIIEQASTRMQSVMDSEIQRLVALQAVNPNVRQEELDALREQRQALAHHLDNAQLQLDAVRVIVAT